MSWLRITRIGWRKRGSDERSTAALSCLDFLTTGALFSNSVDLLTQSDSQAISFGSSVNESSSVSLLTLAQVFKSLMYTKAGAFPLFSHSCMYFPQNGLNCRNMNRIGQKSKFFISQFYCLKHLSGHRTAQGGQCSQSPRIVQPRRNPVFLLANEAGAAQISTAMLILAEVIASDVSLLVTFNFSFRTIPSES